MGCAHGLEMQHESCPHIRIVGIGPWSFFLLDQAFYQSIQRRTFLFMKLKTTSSITLASNRLWAEIEPLELGCQLVQAPFNLGAGESPQH